MAIAFDNSAGSALSSFAFTVGTGASRLLLVITGSDGGASSAVTYAGVAMTSSPGSFSFNGFAVRLWYLFAPASGSNTLAVTGLGGTQWTAAVSYSGARQTSYPDASGTNTSGANVNYSESITTLADNAWTVLAVMNDINTSSAGAGSTSRVLGLGVVLDVYDSNGALAPGSHAMAVTQAGGPSWASAMVSIAPAGVPSMFTVF